MKKIIIIFSLCLVSVFTLSAQNRCDTLKWKMLYAMYVNLNHSPTQFFGNLYGAVINMDTLYSFSSCFAFTNVSNDTFLIGTEMTVLSKCAAYTDTGRFELDFGRTITFNLPNQMNPDDILGTSIEEEFNFPNMINTLKIYGLSFEEITHWEIINMVTGTSKDGLYSDSVVYAGADTAVFYITRTPPPSIIESTPTEISVFPNPAQFHFTVTNTEHANLTLYNVLGQQVKQVVGEGENTIIQTEGLPQGIYILKVEKEGAVLTKKIQISN